MSLTEFLLAQLAVDEATALAAAESVAPEWTVQYVEFEGSSFHGDGQIAKAFPGAEQFPEQIHASRHDPARVLADVKAKRAIIEIHEWSATNLNARADMTTQGEWLASLDTLMALAQPYRGNEGWQEAWDNRSDSELALAGVMRDCDRPKWADMFGAAPDFTGGQEVDEFLDEQRGEA